MGILQNFVTLDLETTGTDPTTDEIISIAAARMRDGNPSDTFHRFVRPETPISPTTEQRTGITDDQLRGAPSIDTVIAEFAAFVSGSPLVAHNAEFAAGFLRLATMSDVELPLVYDTLELSRIALPRLRNHQRMTLIDAFGVETHPEPTGGAIVLGEVVRFLCATLAAEPPDLLQSLIALTKDATPPGDGIGPVVDLITEIATRNVPSRYADGARPKIAKGFLLTLSNTIGGVLERWHGPEHTDMVAAAEPLDLIDIRTVFGPEGSLAQALPRYEAREQQIEMAEAVTQAFNDEEILVCEAGTGTGKSLAYLVPAILWAVRNDRRIVISTNTKTLQEQLFYKDLPLLEKVLGEPFRATLLKGRSNYICMNRWRSGAVTSDRDRSIALPLATWVRQTESGDISENTAFSTAGGPGRNLWSRLSTEGQPCSPTACQFYNDCFLTRIRRASQQAHIVVINHSLLFSDFIADGAVLGQYTDLIIDEAHNLEKVATQYLGAELSWWSVRDLLSALWQKEAHESGLLARVKNGLTAGTLASDRTKTFQIQAARAIDAVSRTANAAQAFFERLNDVLPKPDRSNRFSHKQRYTSEDLPFGDANAEYEEFLSALDAIVSETNTLIEWLRELGLGEVLQRDEFVLDLENRIAGIIELTNIAVDITGAERSDFVYWYELPANDTRLSVRLEAAPLNVGDQLRDSFFPRLRTCIMTSATLAVAGKFTYFLSRNGLTDTVGERVHALAVGSPFDYERQAFVAVPEWFPNPKSSHFQDAVTELVRDIVIRTRRGTLVLFTSYRMLNDTYRAVQQDFSSQGILLLSQGNDVSRTNLADSFRRERESVLFGTESFWQGVDVPGDSLELLIIVRLPFAVPTEPLVIAQGETLRAAGKDPFLYMTVPEAAIRFRQGFGRLIRSQTDRGAVIILDNRVITERFGRAFLGSLPSDHRTYQSATALTDALQQWFDGESTE